MFNRIGDPLYEQIDPEILDKLIGYGRYHEDVPGGLYYCLANDFSNAVCSGLAKNKHTFTAIAKFIFNELPSECWGTPDKVHRWLRKGPRTGSSKSPQA